MPPSYYRTRTDRNQSGIVTALRRAGYSAWDTHRAGWGFPDLVVLSKASRPIFVVFEVKQEGEKLTGKEVDFFLRTDGAPRYIVTTASEALAIMAKHDGG